jgi:hypothetical protein
LVEPALGCELRKGAAKNRWKRSSPKSPLTKWVRQKPAIFKDNGPYPTTFHNTIGGKVF